MKLLDTILDRVGLQIKQRAITNTSIGNELQLIKIGPDKFIKDGYKANPILFSAINWITTRVSKVKWQLFDVTNTEEKIEIFDHDYLRLINNPNPAQSKREFYESACGYKKINGETFIHGVSPDNGVNEGIPQELWVLPSPIMSVKFDGSGIPTKYIVQTAQQQVIEPNAMMYLREFNPGTGNRGMSPIEAGVKVVTQSNDAYTANMRLLQNLGAQGLLSIDDDNANPTTAQIDRMETQINQKYSGASNYGRVMVNSLKWKWQQIGLSATDLALIESQRLSREDICNLFQLPTALFNDPSASTYNNIQEARKTAITDAVIPENDALKDGYNRWLTPLFNDRDNKKYWLTHDVMAYPELQKNHKELTEWLSQAWWMTGNQKLSIMEMAISDNPLMDEILLPTNLMPIGSDHDELVKAYSRHLEIDDIGELIRSNGNVA